MHVTPAVPPKGNGAQGSALKGQVRVKQASHLCAHVLQLVASTRGVRGWAGKRQANMNMDAYTRIAAWKEGEERKKGGQGRAEALPKPAHQSSVQCSFGKEEKKRAGGCVTAEL